MCENCKSLPSEQNSSFFFFLLWLPFLCIKNVFDSYLMTLVNIYPLTFHDSHTTALLLSSLQKQQKEIRKLEIPSLMEVL